jgi:hypothetical protein
MDLRNKGWHMDILNSGYLPAVVECETIDQWISTCCCGMRTRGVEWWNMDIWIRGFPPG